MRCLRLDLLHSGTRAPLYDYVNGVHIGWQMSSGFLTLHVYAGLGNLNGKSPQLRPCPPFPPAVLLRRHPELQSAAALRNNIEARHLRQVVGSSPWRGVLYVIVTWHVLCNHGHHIVFVLGKQEGRCQAHHTSSGINWPISIAPSGTLICCGGRTHPTTTIRGISEATTGFEQGKAICELERAGIRE